MASSFFLSCHMQVDICDSEWSILTTVRWIIRQSVALIHCLCKTQLFILCYHQVNIPICPIVSFVCLTVWCLYIGITASQNHQHGWRCVFNLSTKSQFSLFWIHARTPQNPEKRRFCIKLDGPLYAPYLVLFLFWQLPIETATKQHMDEWCFFCLS